MQTQVDPDRKSHRKRKSHTEKEREKEKHKERVTYTDKEKLTKGEKVFYRMNKLCVTDEERVAQSYKGWRRQRTDVTFQKDLLHILDPIVLHSQILIVQQSQVLLK